MRGRTRQCTELGRHDTSSITGKTMAHVHRISKGPELRLILNSVEAFSVRRRHGPGSYDVGEHFLDPFPRTKVSAGAWGDVIHCQS